MTINMILCTDINGALGWDNKLLFQIPEDLRLFKEKTKGCNVIMGSKTFNSLPFSSGLPDRKNYVLSRTPRKSAWSQDVVWLSHISDWLVSAMHTGIFGGGFEIEDLWVVGGSEVYKLMEPYVDEVHWTITDEIATNVDTWYSPLECIVKNKLIDHTYTDIADGVTVHIYKKEE